MSPYIPTVWVDEVPAESPVKYEITDAGGGLSSIQIQTPVFPGTPMNAANFNKMEAGIETAQAAVEAAQLEIEANAESIQASANSVLKTYGNGGDGDVVISGVVELTRNMFYRNLTISATGELKPKGWIIKVSETLTIEVGGKITANGEDGGVGVLGTTEYIYADNGGKGSWSTVPLGITPLPSGSAGGAGGHGGPSTSYGIAGLAGTTLGTPPAVPFLLYAGSGGGGGSGKGYSGSSEDGDNGGKLYFVGYTGGNGGARSNTLADNAATGGGGGGGGGCMHIYSHTLNNQGKLEAKGGAGATRLSARGGGGGGGGGGMILVIYSSLTGSGLGTIDVSGGTKNATGTIDGYPGTNGYTLNYQIVAP